MISIACAATTIEPLLGGPELAGTVKAIDWLSEPAVVVNAIQSTALDAFQPHPAGVVTVTVAVPPA